MSKLFGIEPPVPVQSFMLCETYTRTVQPNAYGTEKHTIHVWYEIRVQEYSLNQRSRSLVLKQGAGAGVQA